jgi:hypothetical protein
MNIPKVTTKRQYKVRFVHLVAIDFNIIKARRRLLVVSMPLEIATRGKHDMDVTQRMLICHCS